MIISDANPGWARRRSAASPSAGLARRPTGPATATTATTTSASYRYVLDSCHKELSK